MIAVEEHVLPDREDHLDRWRTLLPMIPEQFQPRLIAQLTGTSRRLEATDQGESDLAVLSNAAVVQGSLEPRAALRIARESTGHLAEVVRVRPDRSAAFATTPVQHPQEGADELARAVEQFRPPVTMLFGQTGGATSTTGPSTRSGSAPSCGARPGAGRPRPRRTHCASCSAGCSTGSRGCGSSTSAGGRDL
jgi:hypothetical protein